MTSPDAAVSSGGPDVLRGRLIEAAERAFVQSSSPWPVDDELWRKVKSQLPNGTVHRRDIELILDAVLPPLADTVEQTDRSRDGRGIFTASPKEVLYRAAALIRGAAE